MKVAGIKKNTEINDIIKALGLDFTKRYNKNSDFSTLRYGKVMIMTDQDVDGSHIKGLLINFIHSFWPEMIQAPILEQFVTPLMRVYQKKDAKKSEIPKLNFYSQPEFEKWHQSVADPSAWIIDYYKGNFGHNIKPL